MTSAVTERGTIMNLAVQAAPTKSGTSDTGFTQVMDKAVSANKSGGSSSDAAVKKDTAKTSGRTGNSEAKEQTTTEEARRTDRMRQEKPNAVSEQTQQKDKTAAADDQPNEAGEEAAASEMASVFIEKASEVLTQVAENLSVSVETVTETMQELGMELTDLLVPDRMTELMMTLTGEDQMSLVTDETLYNTLQELTALTKEAGEELMKELSLTPEDLRAMLEQLGTQGAGTMHSDMQNAQDDAAVGNTDERTSGLMTADMKEQMGTQQTDQSPMTDNVQDKTQGGAQIAAGYRAEEDSAQTREKGESFAEGGQGFAEHLMNRTNEFVEALTQETGSVDSYLDAEQIMKQITDFMRNHLNAQGSSVELQLHPASLGTLNISVTAKNGIVTAQFAAQDEAVKTMLEGQVAELRSRLDEQGVKVEAIEVTVSSHEFERNLEQNADQDADERGEAGAKRRTTRRLNLDELGEEDAEELDDAEQIARDMMRIHGNRLDYLA
ncbi:MAG: flagellar hook-length control protein FliK [Lachnospiraceae bacterium]|nr:flagellar hook-length control protein FliK [Lachnospiraceae bacterium]